jgi:Cu/Ag efflux pump CusA
MAFAIMGGLLVATVLTLVFLPALYMAVLGKDDTIVPPPAPAAATA